MAERGQARGNLPYKPQVYSYGKNPTLPSCHPSEGSTFQTCGVKDPSLTQGLGDTAF